MSKKFLNRVEPTSLGSGTPSTANFLRGDGFWASIGGGGSIEYFADTLGTNMSLTSSNVYYTICNVNIPSGTWFVTGFITQVRNATTSETIYGQITRDLPSLVAVAYQRSYHPSANPSGCALSMSAIVSTTDSSTALELKVATSAGSSSSNAWAQSGAGCQLIAIRLA